MELLRKVKVEGNTGDFVLELSDTGEVDEMGKSRLHYCLSAPDGETVFEGNDFCCSPMDPIDSDEAIRSLLGFLTLQPGDTDDEYFKNYTPRQVQFCDEDAEEMSLCTLDDEPIEFEDV